jgi:hypothetical protein
MQQGNVTAQQAEAELRRRGIDPNTRQAMPNAARGLPAPAFNTVRGAPAGVMSNQLKNEDELLDNAAAEASRLGTAVNTVNRFDALMRGTTGDPRKRAQGTGGTLGLPGAMALRTTFGDAELSEMEQLNNQLAPLQRAAGSGAMSDKDLAVFQRSIVSPVLDPAANAQYIAVTRAASQRAKDYQDFLQTYRARFGVGSLADGRRAWQEYTNANPLFQDNGGVNRDVRSWRDFYSGEPAKQQRQAQPQRQPARNAPRERVYDPVTGKLK